MRARAEGEVDRRDAVSLVIILDPLQRLLDGLAGDGAAIGRDAQRHQARPRRHAGVLLAVDGERVGRDNAGDVGSVAEGVERIGVVVDEVVTALDLKARSEPAAQRRMRVVNARVDHGNGDALPVRRGIRGCRGVLPDQVRRRPPGHQATRLQAFERIKRTTKSDVRGVAHGAPRDKKNAPGRAALRGENLKPCPNHIASRP